MVGHGHPLRVRERALVQPARLQVLPGLVLVGMHLKINFFRKVLLGDELGVSVIGAAHSLVGAREDVGDAARVGHVPIAILTVELSRADRL